jgi:DNA-binding MarR family transcriptional regulator
MPAQDSPTPALNLDHFLPYRLSVLSNTISTALAGAYARRFGLSIPQWRVVAVLARSPGLSAASVAERTAMDKVAVSRAVAGLVDAGRVRSVLAESDRRRSVLTLTARGREVYTRIVPYALEYERRLLSELAPAEQGLFDSLLSRLQKRAGLLGPAGAARV